MEEPGERPAKIRKLDVPPGGAEPKQMENAKAPVLVGEDDGDKTTSPDPDKVQRPAVEAEQSMSKNQLKKLRKRQAWEAGKDDRRQKRKERNKARKARKAASGEDAQRSVEGSTENGEAPEAPDRPHQRWQRPQQVPLTLILDCGFDELMTEKEIISLSSQLSRSYSENRKAPFKSHLVISSFRPATQLRKRMETVLQNFHLGWKGVKLTEEDFVEAAEGALGVMKSQEGGKLVGALQPESTDEQMKLDGDGSEAAASKHTEMMQEDTADDSPDGASLVYLSSDSPHTLKTLSPYTSYVIGGLVDKNRHKGICYKRARERGIATAKLPIGEYMEMQSRTVLTTNHVVEIMLRWLEEGDWGKAFLHVIPKRKEAKLRSKKNRPRNGSNGGEKRGAEDNDEEGDGDDDEQDASGSEDQLEGEDAASEAEPHALEV